MEVWDVVALVLGSNFIMALATYLTTKMQIKNSAKKFEIELGRAIDVENRKRKWEVRSEPLLKLRIELADMAMKQERVVYAAQGKAIKTSEEMKSELSEAIKDWTAHIQDYQRNIYLQYDTEIVNMVKEIMGNYHKVIIDTMENDKISLEKFSQVLKSCEKNEKKIIEAQELINKRLEEL